MLIAGIRKRGFETLEERIGACVFRDVLKQLCGEGRECPRLDFGSRKP
jgi:hypothetical protein